MADEQDVILSEGDNEFLRLVRENRERRYNNDTTKSINQGTRNSAPVRLDSEDEQRSEGGREGASRTREEEKNQPQENSEEDSKQKSEVKILKAQRVQKKTPAKKKSQKKTQAK